MANDYDNTQRTLTFAAGETAKVISVSINNDLLLESVETFNASLTSVSTGVVDSAAASATVTLMDNDNVIWAVVADAQSINEAGGQAGFTVSRTGNVQQTDTIVFSTGAGTAVAGSDFTATTQTLTFAAGETMTTYMIDLPRASDPNKAGWGHPALNFMGGWSTGENDSFSVHTQDAYNGRAIYCIEPGIGVHSGDQYTGRGEDFWDSATRSHTNTIPQGAKLCGR